MKRSTLSVFDMRCYSLYESYLLERATSAEFEADPDEFGSNDPLQSIEVVFNGLPQMTLYKFIHKYARIDREANLVLSHLLQLFQEDMKKGRIPGAKGKKDFTKWLVARFGEDAHAPDILIINVDSENPRYIVDEKESNKLATRWRELGFAPKPLGSGLYHRSVDLNQQKSNR